MAEQVSKITIEDAQIVFRNFEGKKGQYNDEGKRRFSIVLVEEDAVRLADLGWNVKKREPRDEEDEVFYHLPVEVNFTNRPPRITMITSTAKTTLTEDSVDVLDFADILKVDLVLNPYAWEVGDKTGIKAYLKTMFVTIDEDDLERKYSEKDEYDG
jgi:hypothetical protein